MKKTGKRGAVAKSSNLIRKSSSSKTSQSRQSSGAAENIRKIGHDWAQNWNAGDLDRVVSVYASDAVYLPPHHEAVHGREAIREYLRGPREHGVTDLAFDVTYIRQSGDVAWDVGTYRMRVPQNEGPMREDHGKYLTVWKRSASKWLITADAWSTDLPSGRPMP